LSSGLESRRTLIQATKNKKDIDRILLSEDSNLHPGENIEGDNKGALLTRGRGLLKREDSPTRIKVETVVKEEIWVRDYRLGDGEQ